MTAREVASMRRFICWFEEKPLNMKRKAGKRNVFKEWFEDEKDADGFLGDVTAIGLAGGRRIGKAGAA